MKKLTGILAVLLAVAIVVAGSFGVQKSNITTELTAMTAERDAVQAKLDETAAQAAELEAKIADLTAAAETAAAELEAAKAEGEAAAAKAAELEAKVEGLEASAANLTADAETAAVELEAAKAEGEAAAAKVAELEAKVEELEAPIKAAAALKSARAYLNTMYKKSPETTMTDYQVVSKVVIGEVEFPIEWTADSDTIQIIPGDLTTIDVDEKNPEEVSYTLTATMTNAFGESASLSFAHKVPAALILEGLSYEEIVAAAYTLEDGVAMEEPQRLFGTIINIPSPYSEEYKNITVDMQIGELADQPIQCYRLSGEGTEKLAVGDQITVEGILKNYKGTIEFDNGCVLVGFGEIISQQGVLDAAYKLEDGVSMTAPTALAGEIISIDSAWSDEYKNITVTIVCDGKTEQPIMCYRLSGEGAEKLAVGDKIAVYGTIKNYKGTIEFDAGCALIPYEAADMARTVLTAYALEDGLSIEKAKTLTGEIAAIDTAWSDEYKNITVTITVASMENNKIMCYRLSGEGAQDLAVGDTITVTGTLKNYKGTIEFDKGCTLDAVIK